MVLRIVAPLPTYRCFNSRTPLTPEFVSYTLLRRAVRLAMCVMCEFAPVRFFVIHPLLLVD